MSLPKISVPFPSTYWVVPNLFLAGEHPAEYSEDATTTRLTALLDAGIRTFVNLTEEKEILRSYARDLHDIATTRGINLNILRIPVPDRGIPSAETLISILDVIDRSIASGKPVFVHCFAGLGRTGTIVGCYLVRHGKATGHDVMAKISGLRSLMPCAREASPQTPEQIELVKCWMERCR